MNKNYQFLLYFENTDLNNTKIPDKLECFRDEKYYKLQTKNLKSTFTCRLKVVLEKKISSLEFEIGLNYSVEEIIKKIHKILRQKFNFTSIVLLLNSKYEIKLSSDLGINKIAQKINFDLKNDFSTLQIKPACSFLKSNYTFGKNIIEKTTSKIDESKLNFSKFIAFNEKDKVVYLNGNNQVQKNISSFTFFEYFINQKLSVFLFRPHKINVIQTFRLFSKNPREKKYDE